MMIEKKLAEMGLTLPAAAGTGRFVHAGQAVRE